MAERQRGVIIFGMLIVAALVVSGQLWLLDKAAQAYHMNECEPSTSAALENTSKEKPMNVEKITVDRRKALELYRAYKTHQHYSQPIDEEIQRTYKLIAQGKVVIRALESIRAAGLNDEGWPKLAIANATLKTCNFTLQKNGSGTFDKGTYNAYRDRRNTFAFPAGTFRRAHPIENWRETAQAMVPLVPIHLRPKRGLANYHIIWEAEWRKVPPVDPMLIRRVGGDIWLIVAAWDLTEVERAAMATRLNG